MEIHSSLISLSGDEYKTFYRDIESLDEVKDVEVHGVQAFAFYNDELVIVYAENNKSWSPPGGGVEPGEGVQEAMEREIMEETNMRVLYALPIGLFQIFEPHRVTKQVRFMCVVEPIGDFIADPDEDITEIKLIKPEDATQYFDWGKTGAHQLKRAIELHAQYLKVGR